jgi:hypothetical protein
MAGLATRHAIEPGRSDPDAKLLAYLRVGALPAPLLEVRAREQARFDRQSLPSSTASPSRHRQLRRCRLARSPELILAAARQLLPPLFLKLGQ